MDLPAGSTFALTGGTFASSFLVKPCRFQSVSTTHGFILFSNSTVQRWLTTAPGAPTTHWYQIRCVLAQPIYVMAGQEITGRLHLVAHSAQSYTIDLTLSGPAYSSYVFFFVIQKYYQDF